MINRLFEHTEPLRVPDTKIACPQSCENTLNTVYLLLFYVCKCAKVCATVIPQNTVKC